MTPHTEKANTGILLAKRPAPGSAGVTLHPMPLIGDPELAASANTSALNRWAFAGLWLFTLLVFLRPNEIVPGYMADFPLVKIVGGLTLLAYFATTLSSGKRLTIWPLEMKMLAVIVVLALIFTPVAFAPQRSINMLTDTFFKVITIFVLMINLINTRARLYSIMKLVVICGAILGLVTIKKYLAGDLDVSHVASAVIGTGGTYFDNTNELALMLDLLLPVAVVFALTGKGLARFGYVVCVAIIGTGAVMTFSRGGFLGLVSIGAVLMWKLGRGKRVTMVLASLLLVGVFAVAMPGGYRERLLTILHPADDPTNSAQERQALLGRAVEVALNHPIIGIGPGNFTEYSSQGKVAHNSYIEIAAELGWTGLLAYMIFLIAPIRSLRRIERGSIAAGPKGAGRELYYFSVGLQAMMVAFMVCSFFASSEYFWYPYYIVGYSISLRRIYAAQLNSGQASANEETASTLTAGALWKINGRPHGAV